MRRPPARIPGRLPPVTDPDSWESGMAGYPTSNQVELAPSTSQLVLLGASNLTVCLPHILRILAASPLTRPHVWSVHGLGRSYGQWSTAGIRGLPSIRDASVWTDLGHSGSFPTDGPRHSVITDVGNDLVYGVPADTVADWIEDCIQRLHDRGFDVVITQLPLERLHRMTTLQFQATKTLFFPTYRLRWPTLQQEIAKLAERLNETADRFDLPLIDQPETWYGFDPIHIRNSMRLQAWQQILCRFDALRILQPVTAPGLFDRINIWFQRPACRRILGIPRYRAQPCLQSDRLTLSVY